LGYARDAVNSYFVLCTLRERGVLRDDIRLQVSIPPVNSGIAPRVFPEPGDLEKIRPGYEDTVMGELETILEKIPGDDLAIQWDCATELQDAYGAVEGLDPDDLSAAVTLANAFIEHCRRRVDWVHLQVLDTSEDAFFAPMAALKPGGARIYLGMIHNMDGFPSGSPRRASICLILASARSADLAANRSRPCLVSWMTI
jgi:hypothetical protein